MIAKFKTKRDFLSILAKSIIFYMFISMFNVNLFGDEDKPILPARIWSDIFDGWATEPFCGTSSSNLPPAFFQQGPRIEAGKNGTPGSLVIANDGVKYMSIGSAIFKIDLSNRVELLAGTPGLSGYRDGEADKALFNGISILALSNKGELLVLEQGNRCLRSLAPQKTGKWIVNTLIGNLTKKKRLDGLAAEASFENLCGMTVFEDGSIFFMDNSFLRLLKDGEIKTINKDGGNGFRDGALLTAQFKIILTNNCLTSDGKNILYVADMWNNVLRKIDWQKQEISTIAGGPIRSDPNAKINRKNRDPFQDGKGMDAFFHNGGGITTVWCDRNSNNVYITVADDKFPHVYTPSDGWVRSLRCSVPIASDKNGYIYTNEILHKLKPGEKPYQLEIAPQDDLVFSKKTTFEPSSIPSDILHVKIEQATIPPVIDGKINDEIWQNTTILQLKGPKGVDISEVNKSEFQILADKKSIYIAVKFMEPAMSLMTKPIRPKDSESFYLDDYLEIFLIPELNPNGNVFQIMVNSEGTTWEAINKKQNAWNPKMEVKVLREINFWTIELAIPFSEISNEEIQSKWRLNIGRNQIKRGIGEAQESSWSKLNSTSSHVYHRFNVVSFDSLKNK